MKWFRAIYVIDGEVYEEVVRTEAFKKFLERTIGNGIVETLHISKAEPPRNQT